MKYTIIPAFVGGLILLYAYVMGFTRAELPSETYTVKAFFEDAGGVSRGTPVLLAGVQVGTVRSISLSPEKRGVLIIMSLFNRQTVPNDSKLSINAKNMLGELELAFTYGASSTGFKDGDMIEGQAQTGLGDMLDTMKGTLMETGDEFNKLLKAVNGLLGTPEFKNGLQETVKVLPKTLKTLNDTLALTGNTVQNLSVALIALSKNGEKLLTNINAEVDTLKDQKVLENLNKALKQSEKSMQEVDAALKKVSALSSGADSVLSDFGNLVSSAKDLTSQLSYALIALNKGEGTGGKLLKDDSLYSSFNQAMLDASALFQMLEKHPNSIIFGKRVQNKKEDKNKTDSAGEAKNGKGVDKDDQDTDEPYDLELPVYEYSDALGGKLGRGNF